MRRKVAVLGVIGAIAIGVIGFNIASADVPFGTNVRVGCDTVRGVQVYVTNLNEDIAVAQNGCTGPDLQNRVRVRIDNARGVWIYQLHRDVNVSGPIRDIDALPAQVWAAT